MDRVPRGRGARAARADLPESPADAGVRGSRRPDEADADDALRHDRGAQRGNTRIRGLVGSQKWQGAQYPPDQFRADANVLEGVDLLGDGTVSDMLWARPAVTVLGIDCPPVVGSSSSVPPEARARVSLRVPPGIDAKVAQDALIVHLEAVAPWHVEIEIEREAFGQPFVGSTEGPAYDAMVSALEEAYGREVTTEGQGGSIPLCNVFRETFPDAEIMLLRVEEPLCLIHAPNESVDPSEIERMALAEALFLPKMGEHVRN